MGDQSVITRAERREFNPAASACLRFSVAWFAPEFGFIIGLRVAFRSSTAHLGHLAHPFTCVPGAFALPLPPPVCLATPWSSSHGALGSALPNDEAWPAEISISEKTRLSGPLSTERRHDMSLVARAIGATLLVLVAGVTSSTSFAQDAARIYARASESVMTLRVQGLDGRESAGTAFLAVREGLALTAWHVVEGAQSVTARFASGEEFEVSGVVDHDARRDLALIRVKVYGRPQLKVVGNEPPVGSKLFAIGAPKGLDFSMSDGILSQARVVDGVRLIQFTCPISPGNSGGPLFNATGDVVGVVSRQRTDGQNLNFAMPASYALALDATLPTKPFAASSVPPAAIAPEHAVSTKASRLIRLDGEDNEEGAKILADQLRRQGFKGISAKQAVVYVRVREDVVFEFSVQLGDGLDRLVFHDYFRVRADKKFSPDVTRIGLQLNRKYNVGSFSVDEDGDISFTTHLTFLDVLDSAEFVAFLIWIDNVYKVILSTATLSQVLH